MALTAKQNHGMFLMLCDYIRTHTDEASSAYYQQLQADPVFAANEIANYAASAAPGVQSILTAIQAQEAVYQAKLTVLS